MKDLPKKYVDNRPKEKSTGIEHLRNNSRVGHLNKFGMCIQLLTINCKKGTVDKSYAPQIIKREILTSLCSQNVFFLIDCSRFEFSQFVRYQLYFAQLVHSEI